MVRRSLRVGCFVFVVVFCGSVLAGCIASDAAVADFSSLHDVAAEHAEAWRPGARLAGAGALEAKDLRSVTDRYEVDLPFMRLEGSEPTTDARVGDGRALYWHFVFMDPGSGDCLALAFLADSIAPDFVEEHPAPFCVSMTPMGEAPVLDSDDAALRGAVKGAQSEDADRIVMTVLLPYGATGAPHWLRIAFAEDEPDIRLHDAVDGSLTHEGSFPLQQLDIFDAFWYAGAGGPGVVLHEETIHVQLSPITPRIEHRFPVDAEDIHGRPVYTYLTFCMPAGEQGFRIGPAKYDIVGPAGATIESGQLADARLLQKSGFELDWRELPAGEYIIETWLDEPVGLLDFRLEILVTNKSIMFVMPNDAFAASDCP